MTRGFASDIMVYFDAGLGDEKKKTPQAAITFVMISVIMGVMSIVLTLIGVPVGGVVFGGMGLVVGGFSFGRAFTAEGNLRKILSALVAAALLMSVLGFMLGFSNMLG